MRRGVQVKTENGYRYAIKCRLCLVAWVVDIPALGGRLMEKHLHAHECTNMALARQSAGGEYSYQPYVFEVAEVMWSADPRGYHPCTYKCLGSTGASCRCECKGEKHGYLKLPAPPATKAEAEELFRMVGAEGRSDQWDAAHDLKSKGRRKRSR